MIQRNQEIKNAFIVKYKKILEKSIPGEELVEYIGIRFDVISVRISDRVTQKYHPLVGYRRQGPSLKKRRGK